MAMVAKAAPALRTPVLDAMLEPGSASRMDVAFVFGSGLLGAYRALQKGDAVGAAAAAARVGRISLDERLDARRRAIAQGCWGCGGGGGEFLGIRQESIRMAKRTRNGDAKEGPGGGGGAGEDAAPKLAEVKRLEAEIQQDQSKYNNIPLLLEVLKEEEGTVADEAATALFKTFSRLSRAGRMAHSRPSGTITLWLQQRQLDYTKFLCTEMLTNKDVGLQKSALILLMALLKEPADDKFPIALFRQCTRAILQAKVSSSVIHEFSSNYINKHHDLLYHFLGVSKHLCAQAKFGVKPKRLVSRLFSILLRVANMPIGDSYSDTLWYDQEIPVSRCRKAFQDCWLSLLSLPLESDEYRAIMMVLTKRVIPHMPKPQFLMDFLTDAYNTQWSISHLALNGLFFLIQKYNLDYPDFYPKLYALFDKEMLRAPHLSTFLRMVEVFLSSSHLPATLVASFIKRMARLALTAQPEIAVVFIPFIYNLLKQHLSCMVMIHRRTSHMLSEPFQDPFDAMERDLNNTRAIESSLWELETLQTHYYPNVATIAKIMSVKFTKPKYNLEDFLDHSYDTVCSV